MKEIAADTAALAKKRTRVSALAMELWSLNSRPCADPVKITLARRANVEKQVDFLIMLERQ